MMVVHRCPDARVCEAMIDDCPWWGDRDLLYMANVCASHGGPNVMGLERGLELIFFSLEQICFMRCI